MKRPRIVIVGGVAGGASAATRARRLNESAEIVIFEKGEHVSFANCGLPYHIGGEIRERSKLLLMTPESFRSTFNIAVHTQHEATRIDRKAKRVEVVNHATGQRRWELFDKLVLAPGAAPVVPPWARMDCQNLFTLRDVVDMDRIQAWLEGQSPKHAVVVGGGFIGLEMVEALIARGMEVTVVEQQQHVLPALDDEMALEVESVLTRNRVKLRLDTTVTELATAGDRVTGVRLAQGGELATDLVLVSIGVRPNVKLAEDAGLAVGPSGAIAVNDQLLTSDPDIYAVGDAAEVVFVVTGEAARIPMAGPANRHGRHAGGHAAAGHAFVAAPVAGTTIVGMFGAAAGFTGMSARAASKAGIPVAVSYALRGHHAGYYPGAEEMILKLVYEPTSGRVLGAQAVGGAGVDKRLDVVATLLHFRGTIDDLASLDLAYAPQFGAAKDPVHIAAFVAQNQRDGLVRQLYPGDRPVGRQLVDVRGREEFATGALAGAVNIPLNELRSRLGELNRDEPVMLNCGIGQRSYNACRILVQSGFRDVWNLAGGYRMHKGNWPGTGEASAAG